MDHPHDPPPSPATGTRITRDADAILAEVRAVLAAFDWESDDRQYALEKIERIVGDAGPDEPAVPRMLP